ncbi:DUF721 domain-containing protein [Candidatus Uhrbacteria bacterium]|nr:DUF721 domain-containing protein [Candidatus Uhrbacteria bacterium]
MAFSSIRRLLPGAAKRAGITRDLAITEVLRACQRELATLFGKEYAKFADAIAVRSDGALVIACRSPAVAQTIRLHDARALQRIRAASPNVRIERLMLIPRSSNDLLGDHPAP